MASTWIPQIIAILEDSGRSTARVVWRNDSEGQKSGQDVPLAGVQDESQFNAILRAARDRTLETSTELVKVLAGKIGVDLAIEAPPTVDPTPEELAKREYFRQVGKLAQMKQALPADHPDLVARQVEVVKQHKLEYYD